MKTVFKVQNLRCSGCATTISNRLERIHGVTEVLVKPEENEVSVDHINNSALNAAVYKLSRLGYPLDIAENTLGMKASALVSCAAGRLSS